MGKWEIHVLRAEVGRLKAEVEQVQARSHEVLAMNAKKFGELKAVIEKLTEDRNVAVRLLSDLTKKEDKFDDYCNALVAAEKFLKEEEKT